MTDAYVIEIGEDAVGLVVRESRGARREKGYRFYASVKGYQSLEGKIFSNPESARRSAELVLAQSLQSSRTLTDPNGRIVDEHSQTRFGQILPIDLPAAC